MIRVLVKGPIFSQSGYGEHARLVYRALRSRPEKFDIYIVPIEWGMSNWPLDTGDKETTEILQAMNKTAQCNGQFDISLQVTVPTEWEPHATYNIGVTAGIETDKMSPEWLQACNQVDQVIVVSEHGKTSMINTSYPFKDDKTGESGIMKCTVPVEVIGYPVKEHKKINLDIDLSTKFNFLAVAQISPRKNVGVMVKEFLEEFHNDDEVGLILKFHTFNNSSIDKDVTEAKLQSWCNRYPDRKCKVYSVHGNLDESELHALYTHPDIKAYVTTTHGEGYGLPVFEAAYSGLPVVAPAWSGQVDFLYAPVKNPTSGKVKRSPLFTKIKYELKSVQEAAVWKGVINADTKWCYVDPSAYRKALRNVYDAHRSKVRLASQLQKYLKKSFSEEVIYKKYTDIVEAADTTDEEIEDLFSQLEI
jgi:glycosyltransferase involved in cell wall biosynthesis